MPRNHTTPRYQLPRESVTEFVNARDIDPIKLIAFARELQLRINDDASYLTLNDFIEIFKYVLTTDKFERSPYHPSPACQATSVLGFCTVEFLLLFWLLTLLISAILVGINHLEGQCDKDRSEKCAISWYPGQHDAGRPLEYKYASFLAYLLAGALSCYTVFFHSDTIFEGMDRSFTSPRTQAKRALCDYLMGKLHHNDTISKDKVTLFFRLWLQEFENRQAEAAYRWDCSHFFTPVNLRKRQDELDSTELSASLLTEEERHEARAP